ncbi:MAG: carbohydrate ABC transporter permease [Lachnospiraceae bacterium]
MTKTRKKDTGFFVIPGFIGILIFVILPLADMAGRSFRLGGMGGFAGLTNYKTVLSNEAFRLAAGNTFRFEVVSVPLLMLLSLFVSIEVYSMKSNIVRFAFLVPMVLPSNAMAVVWKILFSDAGIVNNILVNGLHLEPVSFFEGKAVYALFVGTFVFKNIGYNMLIWIAGLSAVPQEIYDAAKVDGAGSFQTVWYITLPNIRRPAFIAAVLSMVNSFKIFRELYLIAGNYPDKAVYQLQHVFNNWFSKLDISKLTAGAVLTAFAFFGTILLIRILIFTKWREMPGLVRQRRRNGTGETRYRDRHLAGLEEEGGRCDGKEEG